MIKKILALLFCLCVVPSLTRAVAQASYAYCSAENANLTAEGKQLRVQARKYNPIGLRLKQLLERIEVAKRTSDDPTYINAFIDQYNSYSTKYYDKYNIFKIAAEKYNERSDKYNNICGEYSK